MQTILVIRESDVFSRILAENNYEIINLPLIETKVLDDLSEFKAALESIESYDGVFLTSAKAAEIFRAHLMGNFHGRVYVLGKRSHEILKDANFNLRFDETANTTREMMENIAPEELEGKKFLFVRGEKSLRIVPDFLSKTAAVDEAIVYETQTVAVEIDRKNSLREKFETGEIAAVCFFSPSAAAVFLEQFEAEIPHQTIIAAIGKTTAEFFERRDLQVSFVSSKATAEDFAVELVKYLTSGKRKLKNGI
jgi:uroporphyrinogen-III synthase